MLWSPPERLGAPFHLLVPKRVDSERSGAVGRRWAALGRSKPGQCLDDVGDGLEVGPAFGTVGGFSRVKTGCVFAYEGMACHEADEGGAGVAGSTRRPASLSEEREGLGRCGSAGRRCASEL